MSPRAASPSPPSPLLDPKLDVVFKILFGRRDHRDLLVSLLSAVLLPPSPIIDVEVQNPELPRHGFGDKGVELDLHVRLSNRSQIDVEMQSWCRPAMRKRCTFSVARMCSASLHRGQDHGALEPCIGIWFLNHCQLRTTQFHCIFSLRERTSGEPWSDDLQIHTIELPKIPQAPERGNEELWAWARFLRARSRVELEESAMNDPIRRKAVDALVRLSADPEVRRMADEREAALFGWRLDLSAARDEGRTEGRAEGRTEGRAEGRTEGRAEGRTEGRAEAMARAVAEVIRRRGLALREADEARILACRDEARLAAWWDLAWSMTCVEEIWKR